MMLMNIATYGISLKSGSLRAAQQFGANCTQMGKSGVPSPLKSAPSISVIWVISSSNVSGGSNPKRSKTSLR